MSMTILQFVGIGFFPFTGNNTKKVVAFLKNHADTLGAIMVQEQYDQVIATIDKICDNDNLMDSDDIRELFHETPLDEGAKIADAISLIMNCENNSYGFQAGCSRGKTDVETNIVYVESFQWEMTDNERNWSRDDVDKILRKYAEELGVDPATVDRQWLEKYHG